MTKLDAPDWAKSIADDLLGHVAHEYPDVDGQTMRRAFLLAAVAVGERIRATRGGSWEDARPPSASANPWQVEDD